MPDQYDAVLKFATLADAKADPIVQQYRNAIADLFNSDSVIPNIKVWRASQDINGTDGAGNPTVAHAYLPGFFILVSLPRIVPALRDHPALQLVIDRDTYTILRSTVGAVVLQDLRFEPVFAGANYPWGAWPS